MNKLRNRSIREKSQSQKRFHQSWLKDIPYTRERIMQSIPFILFLAFWAVVYIANRHYAEKTERQISYIGNKVKDMRADYLTTKASLMFETKQSEVSQRVRPLGLEELKDPPDNINVPSK